MSQWLIAIGILVVLGILIDGVRRMRGARRDTLRVNINKRSSISNDTYDDSPDYGSELPSGGARVVKVRGGDAFDDDAFDDIDDANTPVADPFAATDTINLGQSVPMLLEVNEFSNTRREPVMSTQPGGFSRDNSLREQGSILVGEPRVVARTDTPPPESRPTPARNATAGAQEPTRKVTEPAKKPAADAVPQQVLVINVMSRAPEHFAGKPLLDVLLGCGMRYGAMSIFHHHGGNTDGEPMYSMANMVKPGVFDLNTIDTFTTPGVSFFMTLPSPVNPHQCFDTMLATARAVASKLNGELRDDSRSVMTAQTIEYYRQRIRDFERKR